MFFTLRCPIISLYCVTAGVFSSWRRTLLLTHTPLPPEAGCWEFLIECLPFRSTGSLGWMRCQRAPGRPGSGHHFSVSTLPSWSPPLPQSLGSVCLVKSSVEIVTPFPDGSYNCIYDVFKWKSSLWGTRKAPYFRNSYNLSFSGFCYMCISLHMPKCHLMHYQGIYIITFLWPPMRLTAALREKRNTL